MTTILFHKWILHFIPFVQNFGGNLCQTNHRLFILDGHKLHVTLNVMGANTITWATLTYLRNYFWGNFFLYIFFKFFKNILNILYYYVKVLVKDFQIHVIFKSFEVYLKVILMFKNTHYNECFKEIFIHRIFLN